MVSYEWDFDNDGQYDDASGKMVIFSSIEEGEYTVTLKVTDSDGEWGINSTVVTVENFVPIANAGGPYVVNESETILLDASGSIDPGEDIISYEWDLDNDGQYDDASGVTTSFSSNDYGNYTVSLKITDRDGTLVTDSTMVAVNAIPIANAGGPYVVDEGASITLDASGSTDPDNNIVAYDWDLNNDGLYDDANGETISFSFADDGMHTIAVKVTDDNGAYGIDSTIVTVNNAPPTVDLGGPYEVDEGSSVILDLSESTGLGQDIVAYEWDLDNDGQYDDASGETATFSRTDSGSYTVSVKVTDDHGCYGTDNTTINVSNVAPSANAGGPYMVDEGASIILDVSGSTDPGNDIVSYSWDLDNDGLFEDALGGSVGFSQVNDGSYTVSVKVIDADGAEDTDIATVTVNNVAPTADAGGTYEGDVGETIILDAHGSNDPGKDIILYEWDLDGDGIYHDASEATAEFTRIKDGDYTVSVRVTDDDGESNTSDAVVTVSNLPPTVSLQPGLTIGVSDATISVIYADGIAVSVATIDANDIMVTGPNGYSQNADLVNVDDPNDGTPRTATYRVTASGSEWLQADNGTYQIAMVANQVSDTFGLFAVAGTLGSFDVVTAVDDTATITEDAASLAIDGSDLTANDGGACSIVSVACTVDTHGQVELTGQTITYTPDASFIGTASFEYTVVSDWGIQSTATVTVAYPQTIVVDSLVDAVAVDGVITLREAIQAANTNLPAGDAPAGQIGLDRITFDPLLYADGPVTIAFCGIISDDLDIQGPGANLLAIDAAGQNSVFKNESSASSIIAGITITGGYGRSGGGIYNSGSLTIIDCMISNNMALSAGCGIYNFEGDLNVINSTVSNNYQSSSNSSCVGGGICNHTGTLTVVNSTIARNRISGNYSKAGGIFNDRSLIIINSTIVDNTVESDGYVSYLYGGGGIYSSFDSVMAINNTIVARNSAVRGPDIYPLYSATLSGSYNFIGDGSNQPVFVDGVDGNQVGTLASPIDPMLSSFTQLDNGISGYYLLPDSPAVEAGDNDLALDPTGQPLIEDASGNDRIVGDSVDIGAVEGANAGTPAQTYIVESLENTIASDGILTFREAFMAANSNQPVGDVAAGSFSATDTIQFAEGLSGTILLENGELTIQDNLNIEGPGAELLTFDAGKQSRVFFVQEFASVSLSGMTLTRGSMENDGGAIYNKGTLTLAGVTLNRNSANSHGGAIYNGGTMAVTDTSILENSVDNSYSTYGGGIYNAGELTITGSTISDNSISSVYSHYGGGIYNAGTLTVKNSTVSGNSTGGSNSHYGGGIYNADTLTVINSTIMGNYAQSGGGIANGNYDTLTIVNSTITSNAADYQGGGVYGFTGSATIQNSIIALNSANQSPDRYIDLDSNSRNNLIGVDPKFVRTPSDGGDGWADNSDTADVDESANNDYGNLQLHPGSPAIDMGYNTLAVDGNGDPLLWDIRGQGYHRILNDTVDIGAFECFATCDDVFLGVANQAITDDVASNDSLPTSGGALILLNDVTHGDLVFNPDGTFTYVPETDYRGLDSFIYQYQGLPENSEIATVSFLLTAEDGSLVVTTVDDENEMVYDANDLSLREAIWFAEICEGDNVITFDSSMNGQQITLDPSLGEIIIDSNVSIVCSELVTINANRQSRVFSISEGVTASIQGLTITGGQAIDGGGIYNDGTLSLINSIILGNSVKGYYTGGGIYNNGSLTLTNSIITHNLAKTGGGIYCRSGSTTIVQNSIISLNNAVSYLDYYGNFDSEIDSDLLGIDPLFVRNPSDGGDGWGDNPDTLDTDEAANDDYGDLRLQASSPAIDAGSNTLAVDDNGDPLFWDMRGEGYSRIFNGTVDIGVFEYFGADDDSFFATEDQAIEGDVSGNDIPPNDEAVVLMSDVAHGVLTFNADGTFSYMPDSGYSGTDYFTYKYNGIPAETNVATVSLVIVPQDGSFIVTTPEDENDMVYDLDDLSLREAIWLSEIHEGDSTITFDPLVEDQRILLDPALGELIIDSNVSIIANNAVTIDADRQSRVLNVPEGVTASFEGLVITGGQDQYGAGIYNAGTLTIMKSTILENAAGIYGSVIENCKFSVLSIINSTFANNSANTYGDSIQNNGALIITNSTISGNRSNGISCSSDAQLEMNNTIVAGNSNGNIAADFWVSAGSTIPGSGNLIGNTNLGTEDAGNINDNLVGSYYAPIDPMLSELTQLANGQWGYYLLPGSPAMNAGKNELAVDSQGQPLTEDILGNTRTLSGVVNAGAMETPPSVSTAQTYLVTGLGSEIADDGILTFAEAFQAATTNLPVGNALAGSFREKDTIRFAEGLSGSILLNDGELFIRGKLSIEGPGAEIIAIDAGEQSRVFTIQSNAFVEISGITITGGLAQKGGGIFNDYGTVVIENSKISNNSAENGGRGAGIYNNRGSVSIRNSTVSGNAATTESSTAYGGGIYNKYGDFFVINSTISNNISKGIYSYSTAYGGGIYNSGDGLSITNSVIKDNLAQGWSYGKGGGGVYTSGDMTITNSTITGNVADARNSYYYGGGILISNASVTLNNTIVAGNVAENNPDIHQGGTLSGSYNLIGDTTGQTSLKNGVNGNQVGYATSPLDPLLDENGYPQPDSSVIDAGSNDLIPDGVITDYSLNYRIAGSTVDIGALEFESTPILPGDANGDGRVDGSDVTILAGNWQAGATGDPSATWSMGDFNHDGKVDGSDVTILAGNWQAGVTSAVVAVSNPEPEPSHHFTPPANASLGVATVPRRESLPLRRFITPTPKSNDVAFAESTWTEIDYTAIAKDLMSVSAKKSTAASDELFALELDPYADLD